MTKLYRGISKIDDHKLNGKLIPKGDEREIAMRYGDPGLRYDGKFTYGKSENNTARAHQIEAGMHNGCCISTTRDLSVAKHFATSGNIEDGYVYVIDETKLEEYGVAKHEFPDSEHPNENEVTCISNDCDEIPMQVIIEKIEVKPT